MKQKIRKQLLIFFVSLILLVQIFYVVAYAAAPSFYPDYFEAVFKVSNLYFPNYYVSEAPTNSLRPITTVSYFSEDVGSFIYTGPIDEDTLAESIVPDCSFDGESAGIVDRTGGYVTNMVLYQVPLNISYDDYSLNLSLVWFGSNIDALKINDSLFDRNFIGHVRFNDKYARDAVLRIFAYDSLGDYTQIPSENISFSDLYLYENAPLNPNDYNNGGYSTRSDYNMYARDIIISDFKQNDISYLQIYILSSTQPLGIPLFDGAQIMGDSVSMFTYGESNVSYFQRLGIKAENWITPPPDPPTDNELIIQGLDKIETQLQENLDYLSIPSEIQKGIYTDQKDRFDQVGSDLGNIGDSISSEDYQVNFDDIDHSDQFMNLYNQSHAALTIGRFWDASVVKRLFFLMITFALISYVMFGKAG